MASEDNGDIGAALNQALVDMGQALGIWARNVERLMREAGVLPPVSTFDDPIAALDRQVENLRAEVGRMRAEVLEAGREKFKAELDARQKGERIALLEGQLAELRDASDDGERFENETGYQVALSRLRREVDEARRNARVSIDHAEQRVRVADSRIRNLEQEAMGKDREIAELAAKLAAKADPPWWSTYRADFIASARRVSGWETVPDSATPSQILQALDQGLSADDRDRLQAAKVHLSDELAKATARADAAERQLATLTKNRDDWAESARAVKTQNEQLLREVESARDSLRVLNQERTLTGAIDQIQDVVTRQIEWTQGAGTAAQLAVDIRRRMLNRWSVEHDWNHHGTKDFAEAIRALLLGQPDLWPFPARQYEQIEQDRTRWLHISALAMCAHDARTFGEDKWADK